MTQLHKLTLLSASVLAVVGAPAADAIIIHDGQDQVAANRDAPPDAVVGKWVDSGTASAVAIDPYFFLASDHQYEPGEPGMYTANFGGQNYSVVNSWQVGGNNVDLRLVQIDTNGPALSQYVSLTNNVTGNGNAHNGDEVAMGGWGVTRGSEIDEPSEKGYNWGSTSNEVVWGYNTVGSNTDVGGNGYSTKAATAQFLHWDDPNAVDGEAMLGGGDSGGGWFIEDNGQWRVIAISIGVDTEGKALWDPSDGMYAVDLSYKPYHDHIMSIVPEPGSLALLAMGAVLLVNRRRQAG